MIERLGPQVAIGTDGVQWIIYKRRAGNGILWQDACWEPVVTSSRARPPCAIASG